MKIISLLGDQVAPILMLAESLSHPAQIHVLTTMAKKARAHHLQAALEMLHPSCGATVHLLQNHYDMQALEATARSLIGDGLDTFVDLTGGTELMCLALYRATLGTSARSLYVDTETGVIRDVTGEATNIFRARLPHIPSAIVFRAYGKASRDDARWLPPAFDIFMNFIEDNFSQWCDFFYWYNATEFKKMHNNPVTGEIHFIKDCAIPGGDFSSLRPAINSTLSYLKALGWLAYRPGGEAYLITVRSEHLYNFLRHGSWLEEYIYRKLAGRFREVRKNVSIYDYEVYAELTAQGGHIGHRKDNEVDVIVNDNGKMVFLECKAGYANSIFRNTAEQIPKLEATAHKNAGYFARTAIVLHRCRQDVPETFIQRAQSARIEILCREDLSDLASRIACWL